MPVPVSKSLISGSPRERLDAFRKTIKDDEGYTLEELEAIPTLGIGTSYARELLRKNKWSILQYDVNARKAVHLLVNPKTLAKHAK